MFSIWYRKTSCDLEEINAIKNNFTNYDFLSGIKNDSKIIARYSVLPFYELVQQELKIKNCQLINSYAEYNFIADITNYYDIIKDYTPKTYLGWKNLDENKKYIIKGKTNSRKNHWNQLMFCDGLKEVKEKMNSLLNDTLIGEQGVVVRDYIELESFGTGINGIPISNEWRTFFYKDKMIDSGFYWSNYLEYKPYDNMPQEARNLANKVAKIISNYTNFFVIDVAKTKSGEWIVIELNDGQMSGLSDINPERFYYNLRKVVNE